MLYVAPHAVEAQPAAKGPARDAKQRTQQPSMSEFPLPLPPGGAQKPRQSAGRWRTVSALMLREMGSRYGRSPGGYLWAILEPIGMIIIMAVAFSLLLRSPSLGNSFILFYATGYVPFNLFIKISQTVAAGIRYSKPLLTYPAVSWIDAIFARALLNFLTNALVAVILFAMLIAVLDLQVVFRIGFVLEAFAMAFLMGLGIGMLNCVIMGFVPVWETIWGIITRPLFLASGVLIIYEDVPRTVQEILIWNPLLHISGIMRMGFYSTYAPQYISYPFVLFVALALVVFGMLLLRRHYRWLLQI